jgi:hypothetical protein
MEWQSDCLVLRLVPYGKMELVLASQKWALQAGKPYL